MSDPRIDDYIAKAQPFAQAIPRRIRAIFHAAMPGAGEMLNCGKRWNWKYER